MNGFSSNEIKDVAWPTMRLRHSKGQAAKDRRAEMVFQQLDLPADCAMREMELFCRKRHAQASRCCLEGAEGLQGRNLIGHRFMRDLCSRIL